MLIILEGPDLAGKSTLAAALQVYLAAKHPYSTVTLLHRGPPTEHPLDEYVTPLLTYVPGGNEHIICDRWHIGEIVYPRLLGRPTKMTAGVGHYIDMFLESRGALITHVNVDDDTLRRRFAERGDTSRTLDEVLAVARMFRSVADSQFTRAKIWTPERALPINVVANAKRLERQAMRLHALRTYVGSPFPRTLYVGDVRHKHHPLFPAFGPYPATSGAFLMRVLTSQLVLDEDTGLVNINDVDSPELVRSLIYDHPHGIYNVVALGRAAQRTLRAHGIEHTAVPHPQFARRFHHNERVHYAHLLSLRDRKDHISWPIERTSSPRPGGKRTTMSSRT